MTLPAPDLIYVDASGWIALVNRRDAAHHQATHLYRQHLVQGGHFITTSAVLLEMGNWLSPAHLRQLALDLMDRIGRSTLVEVEHITLELYSKGWELFRNRPDKDWGVIDCISFVVMTERGIGSAMTGDHHFEQAGFIKLL
jgi:uncharacterized protein